MLHVEHPAFSDTFKPLRLLLVPLACAGLAGCPDSENDSRSPDVSRGGADASRGGEGGEGGDFGLAGEAAVAGAAGAAGAAPVAGAGSPDSGGAGGHAGEPDAIERSVGLVLAAPDLPPQFVCLASFEPDAEGKPTGEPVLAGGPFGIPDRTDPTGRKLAGGFPYGSVVRLPVRARDDRRFDGLVPVGFYVDDVSPREFAGPGNESEACKRAWAAARDVPARQLPMADLKVGDSWIAGVSGCVGPSSVAECGGGANWAVSHASLELAAPSSSGGTGDLSFTLQVAHLAADPQLQDVDLYLQPMRTEGDVKLADGEPIALGGDVAGLSRGDLTSSIGVRLASTTAKETLLLIVPHGTPPCLTGEDCATIAVPIQPSLDRYGSPMGGPTGAAWAGHQVIALFGRAPLAEETPASALRLGIFDASLP